MNGIPYSRTAVPRATTTYNANLSDALAVAPADMNYDPVSGITSFSNPSLGGSAALLVGFHGTAPTAQRASADQAIATDEASAIVLVNELRLALVNKGLIKGEA